MIFITDNMKNLRPPPCAGVQTKSALSAQNIEPLKNTLPASRRSAVETVLRC